MELILAAAPTILTIAFLVLAIGLALGFEFVNGFHDTANAVATVIYTNTLKATPAVIWSGVWNLIGALASSGAVAFGIIALLPVELVINVGSTAGFAMVFALLLSAIIWNLGTWYFGLPASSSHTLIGSILGVGLANSIMHGGLAAFSSGVNWTAAKNVGLALLLSPLVGFCCAALLLLLAKLLIRNPALYATPQSEAPPPLWIRGLLMISCTGVSFAHGSNDGQKGMGLIVLILVGILPGMYALNMDSSAESIRTVQTSAARLATAFSVKAPEQASLSQPEATKTLSAYLKADGQTNAALYAALTAKCDQISQLLAPAQSFDQLTVDARRDARTDFYLISSTLKKLGKTGQSTDPIQKAAEADFVRNAEKLTNHIPLWVKIAVALALGLGTMIGYRRIVVTVGEKIGKAHISYAQGASAELVAMCTILAADRFGLPVSTTHVLSSGIAGTMAANRSGLQGQTVRNILLAWVLTLPVCIFLGALFFAFVLNLLFLLGLK